MADGETGGNVGSTRILIILALAVLAAVGAVYLSGYLALLFLGLDGGLVGWGTYVDYLRHLDHPRVQPYAWRIKTAGALGGGIAVADQHGEPFEQGYRVLCQALVKIINWAVAMRPNTIMDSQIK